MNEQLQNIIQEILTNSQSNTSLISELDQKILIQNHQLITKSNDFQNFCIQLDQLHGQIIKIRQTISDKLIQLQQIESKCTNIVIEEDKTKELDQDNIEDQTTKLMQMKKENNKLNQKIHQLNLQKQENQNISLNLLNSINVYNQMINNSECYNEKLQNEFKRKVKLIQELEKLQQNISKCKQFRNKSLSCQSLQKLSQSKNDQYQSNQILLNEVNNLEKTYFYHKIQFQNPLDEGEYIQINDSLTEKQMFQFNQERIKTEYYEYLQNNQDDDQIPNYDLLSEKNVKSLEQELKEIECERTYALNQYTSYLFY